MTAASVTSAASDALGRVLDALGTLSALDWVLVAGAVVLVVWAWLAATSTARLGTIAIDEIVGDGEDVPTHTARAELQERLGGMGVLPPSGVPAGAPTASSLADAVAEAPLPQAKWIGALLGLIRWPRTSSSFQVSATLRPDGPDGQTGLTYELVALRRSNCVALDTAWGADRSGAIAAAANEIYLAIARSAPGIYPAWARWQDVDALELYRAGLRVEDEPASSVEHRYSSAATSYRAAAQGDRNNMLVRLRIANCLERQASAADSPDDGIPSARRAITLKRQALEAYVSVRLRAPTIFEARFRTSVLLSTLADAVERLEDSGRAARADLRALAAVLQRLDQEKAARRHEIAASSETVAVPAPKELAKAMRRVARSESRGARRRLHPLWTIVWDGRFRHRFEPTGRERRQLRRAMGLSQMCLLARNARGRAIARDRANVRDEALGPRDDPLWDFGEPLLRAWVYVRYLALRKHSAGVQAMYNAACFYALVPRADRDEIIGSTHLRTQALRYLRRAIDASEGELGCRYVRDEDPDLAVLRKPLTRARFERVVGRLCPDDVVVRYRFGHQPRPQPGLKVDGPGVAPADQFAGAGLLPADAKDDDEIRYRVRIFDENQPVILRLPAGGPSWTFVPAQMPGPVVTIRPGDPGVHPG